MSIWKPNNNNSPATATWYLLAERRMRRCWSCNSPPSPSPGGGKMEPLHPPLPLWQLCYGWVVEEKNQRSPQPPSSITARAKNMNIVADRQHGQQLASLLRKRGKNGLWQCRKQADGRIKGNRMAQRGLKC